MLHDRWIIDVKYLWYTQSEADFYQELLLFASQNENDYRARDKELNEFENQTLSLHVSYE